GLYFEDGVELLRIFSLVAAQLANANDANKSAPPRALRHQSASPTRLIGFRPPPACNGITHADRGRIGAEELTRMGMVKNALQIRNARNSTSAYAATRDPKPQSAALNCTCLPAMAQRGSGGGTNTECTTRPGASRTITRHSLLAQSGSYCM